MSSLPHFVHSLEDIIDRSTSRQLIKSLVLIDIRLVLRTGGLHVVNKSRSLLSG